MKTKLFTLFVALIGATQLFAHDFEVDGIYYNFLGGDSVTVTYRGNSFDKYGNEYRGSVTIPETISYNNMTYRITSIDSDAFHGCSSLTSITIPNSVTFIGYYAFSGCSSLETITVEIGNAIYHSTGNCLIETATKTLIVGCKNSIIPTDGSVTSIGNYAFDGCSSLTSITIPNSVTTIGDEAFYGCSSLVSISIGNNVTSMGIGTFGNCYSLTSIEWNARCYTDLMTENDPFYSYDYTSYSSVNLRSQITSFIFGDSVQYIPDELCKGMENLTTLTIPNSVISIGNGAFSGCSGLTSIAIPNSVTSIGSRAFQNCYGLTSINIPNQLTTINDYVFAGLTSLPSITIPESVTIIGNDAFSGCSGLTSITIPESVTIIGDGAFSGCSELTSIAIPNSVTSIGRRAFFGCSGLTSIAIPNSVTSIGSRAFLNCYGLTSINIPNQLTTINDYVFAGLTSLPSITIPESVTIISNDAFSGCKSLTSIIIPDHVTSIGDGCFWNCTNLKSVQIGKSVSSIGQIAFDRCSKLTSVVWNATRCSNFSSYTEGPFYSIRKQITSFTFGDTVDSIPDYLCDEMLQLISITIPNGVTYIGKSAFYGCKGLRFINFPASVTTINGSYAFRYCDNISTILVESKTPPTWVSLLEELNEDTYVFVPCGFRDAYLANNAWASRFHYFMESETISSYFAIKSNDTKLGKVIIQEYPTCNNPVITVQAEPRDGHSLVSWSDGDTNLIRSIEVTDSSEYIATFTRDPNYKITLYVQKPEDWDAIYLYTWLDESSQPHGSWPGTKMTQVDEDGWYYYTFHQSVKEVNYIFNYGSDIWKTNDLYTDITTYTILEETGNEYKVFTAAELEDRYGYYTPKSCIMKSNWVAECEITDVIVEPNDNSAAFTWPAVDGASSYVLIIWADTEQTEKICTLTFDAAGHLTNIDFSRNKPAMSQSTIVNGLNFTVTGLDAGTTYTYSLSSYDNAGAQIETKTGTFTTTGITGFEDILNNTTTNSIRKVLENGTIYILRNGEKYTIDGRKVE